MSKDLVKSALEILFQGISDGCSDQKTKIYSILTEYVNQNKLDDDVLADWYWFKSLPEWTTEYGTSWFCDEDFYVCVRFEKEIRVFKGDACVLRSPTRGDIRKLCRLLKHDLKESET
jgi:hypothetical protein